MRRLSTSKLERAVAAFTRSLAASALAAVAAASAHAAQEPNAYLPRGDYICTVEQKAGIAAEEQEGADPPAAFIDQRITRFRIAVTPPEDNAGSEAVFRVQEKPYRGPDRDPQTWQTKNAVLHSDYRGDGRTFTAAEGPAFLRLDIVGEAGWLMFYHAGFEHPDRDNIKLSVRSGTCAPDR